MAEAKTTLIFRYDDYHASLGAEKDDNERRFLAAFAEAGVPLTVGVVPNYEEKGTLGDDAAKLGALRDLVADGRVEAALHGSVHLSVAPRGVPNSEFAGRPRQKQAELLRTGKAQLEDWLGCPVTTFIPPWNTLDAATLDALAETGFRAYSAARSGLQATTPVLSVPHTAGLGELRRTLRWLARRRGRAFVVCMFHHFSFTDCHDDLARVYARVSLAELPALLTWCREQAGLEFATVGGAAERHHATLSDGRLAEAAERCQLIYCWRRTPVLRGVLWLSLGPHALIEPGGWERGSRWLRRLARLGRKTIEAVTP